MLSFLTKRKPTPAPARTPAPPADLPLNRKLLADLEKVETFPNLSDTATRAMSLVNDPDSSLADMAALVRRDGVLVAALLKVANSPAFRGRSEVADVTDAVGRLGLRGCSQLMSGLGLKGMYDRHPPHVRGSCELVLRHSLFAACVAGGLNQKLQLGMRGDEFTAALLHDIGRIVICVKAADVYLSANLPEYDEADDLLAQERQAFGTDHTAVGSLFAVKNQLPTPIARAIMNHHAPSREADHKELVALVALADALANHVQLAHNLTGFPLDDSAGTRC